MKRIKKFNHAAFVNSCHISRRGIELIASGADDGKTRIWDLRQKKSVGDFENKYQITAVQFNDTAEKIFAGGIDNNIRMYDLRKKDIVQTLQGHTDTITGLALSHDGSYLLSNSMDLTIKCWDIRPFVVGDRAVKVFQGATHSQEKNLLKVAWSPNGQQISAGSADKYLYIWDTTSKKILHKLGGHNGSINETCFSPKDNLIASASSDRTIIIGEIPDFNN